MKKRVTGKRKRPKQLLGDGRPQRNLCRRLDSRQLTPSFKADFRRERFAGFGIVREIIVNGARVAAHDLEPSGRETSAKVVEILASPHFIFVLNKAGTCFAYSHHPASSYYRLNASPDEVIRSIFFNSLNNSLVLVSVNQDDGYSSLRCRSLPIPYIQRNCLSEWLEPFAEEALSWPGFIEFDEINDHVITFSATTRTYKVWELKNYELLYALNGTGISEIKTSAGLMLLISEPTAKDITLRVLCADSGQERSRYRHRLQEGRPIEFIELFLHKIFIKQEGTPLCIFDSQTREVTEAAAEASSQLDKPAGFIFLHERRLFLTIRHGLVSVWDLHGRLISKLEDHQLWGTNVIHVPPHQDLIISLCASGGFFDEGTINVSDVVSGRCVAKLGGGDDTRDERTRARAMDNVTALHFCDARNELYTGTKAGLLHVWTNRPELVVPVDD